MSFDMDWLLSKDDSLYFYPNGHEIKGEHKVEFILPKFNSLTVTDVRFNKLDSIMLEFHGVDFDGVSRVAIFQASETISSVIDFLEANSPDNHNAIYKVIYEWACEHL